MAKDTNNLLQILNQSDSIENYINSADKDFIETTLSKELLKHIDNKKITASKLFLNAGIDKSYGYEIISGTKTPARDKVVRLIVALELSQEEAQSLLKSTGYPALYPKDKRDSVILFSLKQGCDVYSLNETLIDLGLDELS